MTCRKLNEICNNTEYKTIKIPYVDVSAAMVTNEIVLVLLLFFHQILGWPVSKLPVTFPHSEILPTE